MVKLRVLTALALAAVLLLAVLMAPPMVWRVFVALIMVLAARECFALFGVTQGLAVVFGGAAALPVLLTGLVGPESLWRIVAIAAAVLAAVFWLLVVPYVLRRRPLMRGIGWRYGAGFVLLCPAGLAMFELRQSSPWLLLAAMAPVWVADIAAFFVGRKFGRRKLAPNISPAKSWEGVGGAVVGVVLYALLLRQAVPAFSNHVGVGLALILALSFTALGVVGDLFESLLKRQAGVKDSGTLLPGHGGVLDRVDSLLSTLPFAGVLLILWQHLL